MIEEFERHLRGTNLSENTVTSYLFAVRQLGERHDTVTKRNLKEHKAWLIEQYKPKTVNLRIRAIIHQGAAESLPRKCHQRSRLHLFQKLLETRWQYALVFCHPFFGCYGCARQRAGANQS